MVLIIIYHYCIINDDKYATGKQDVNYRETGGREGEMEHTEIIFVIHFFFYKSKIVLLSQRLLM